MSVTNIPASTVTRCDACGVECRMGVNHVHQGKLTLVRAGLDFQGHPVADASVTMDLCDRCNDKLAHAINERVGFIRSGQ